MEPRLNPYNFGGITGDAEGRGFFGREDVFEFVRQALANERRPPILLQGQRRIGKSSVLRQIPHRIGEGMRCAIVDLQGKARLGLDDLLYALAREVAVACGLPRPRPEHVGAELFDAWLTAAMADLGGLRKLVLLLDEFDVVDGGAEGGGFVPWLAGFLERLPSVGCVMVVGRKSSELSEQTTGALLRGAVHHRIGRLSPEQARQLVVSRGGDAVRYDDAALKAILHHAAGHPYCTQLLCNVIWNRAIVPAVATPVVIDAKAVDEALLPAIDHGTLGLNWIYDGLEVPSHRFFLGAMAELAQEHPDEPLPLATIERHLFKRSLAFDAAELRQAPVKLANWDVVETSEAGHRFSVPMIGLWIRRNRPLADLAAQTHLVSPRAWRYYELAALSAQRENWDEAVNDFGMALQSNPALTEAHLGRAAALRARHGPGDLAAAIESYERALDLDPNAPRKALLEVLAQLIDESGHAVPDQLRCFDRIKALDDTGEFQRRAARALAKFAHERMGSLKTVDGAALLFEALGDPDNAARAALMSRLKARQEGWGLLAFFVGIAAALTPFHTVAEWAGITLDEVASSWASAIPMSLGFGLFAYFMEVQKGYATLRRVALPIAGVSAGVLAHYLSGSLLVTGIVAFVGAVSTAAWADNSPALPASLKPPPELRTERPFASQARRVAQWLARYAHPRAKSEE